jgi:hypothetical protein
LFYDYGQSIKPSDVEKSKFDEQTILDSFGSPLSLPEKRRICLQDSPCWIDNNDDIQTDLNKSMENLTINCINDDDNNTNDENSDKENEFLSLADRLKQQMGQHQSNNIQPKMIDLTQDTPVKVITKNIKKPTILLQYLTYQVICQCFFCFCVNNNIDSTFCIIECFKS